MLLTESDLPKTRCRTARDMGPQVTGHGSTGSFLRVAGLPVAEPPINWLDHRAGGERAASAQRPHLSLTGPTSPRPSRPEHSFFTTTTPRWGKEWFLISYFLVSQHTEKSTTLSCRPFLHGIYLHDHEVLPRGPRTQPRADCCPQALASLSFVCLRKPFFSPFCFSLDVLG